MNLYFDIQPVKLIQNIKGSSEGAETSHHIKVGSGTLLPRNLEFVANCDGLYVYMSEIWWIFLCTFAANADIIVL